MIEKIVRKEVELQEGVKLYSVPDAKMSDEELREAIEWNLNFEDPTEERCQDMEIEPGVKTLILGGFDEFVFSVKDKIFPNIVEIHICKNVSCIIIDDDIFPNVRKIVSESPYFLDSDMLVRLPDDIADMVMCGEISKEDAAGMNRGILENVFSRRPDEVVDLKGIKEISVSCSFSGCETKNIINTDSVTDCSSLSFCLFKPFQPASEQDEYKEDGILGTILAKPYINPEQDENNVKYVFPDTKITAIATDAVLRADTVVIKNESQIRAVLDCNNTFGAKTVILDINAEIDFSLFDYRTYYIQNIEVSESNPYYKSINGIVYSKDGKKLIKCSPARRCYTIKIPEGVEEIDINAFDWNNNIYKIQLPETLKNLKSGTFTKCEKLGTIYIPSSMEYIEDECFYDYFYAFGLVRIKDRKLPKNLIKAISPKLSNEFIKAEDWTTKIPYVVIHLVDKDSNPLEKIENCKAVERLYLPMMHNDKVNEINEYYNSHLLDTKYAEETWKYCCDSVSSLKLVTKVFFFINNKNEDVNECIHKRGSAICYFLIEDLKKSVNKYIEGDSTARQKVRLRGINRRKEILLSIVNSGLLQEDALALVSDFIAAFDVSAIANAAAEQQKKIEKKEEKKD